MNRPHGSRIYGVETEFGALVRDESMSSEMAVELIKDCAFHELNLGLIDLHARDDMFEPARSGGFLVNGGRLYIDAVGSHLEYATAECRTLRGLIANDRAGQRIINRAIRTLGMQDRVGIFNNAIDHFGGHTFGCHENFLVQMDDDFFSDKAPLLFAFLVTRQIFAGVGRVGGHVLVAGDLPTEEEIERNFVDYVWVHQIYQAIPDDTVEFQISQRADHILKGIAGKVRFNRALINPKWEHFYSHGGMHRLHLLFGEANQSEYAYALKIGTTHLALRLLEDGLIGEEMTLAAPLKALRDISRDPEYKWRLRMADGQASTALEVQRTHLALAEKYRGEDAETDWVLDEWKSTLDGLESDPLSLGDRLDWVAKKRLMEMYREAEGLAWNDAALHSADMQYHSINPADSLFYGWADSVGMRRIVDEVDVIDAEVTPPANTRAHARSQLLREMMKDERLGDYAIDWNAVMPRPYQVVELMDPFDPELPQP
jgi:proteasome accessory factor A